MLGTLEASVALLTSPTFVSFNHLLVTVFRLTSGIRQVLIFDVLNRRAAREVVLLVTHAELGILDTFQRSQLFASERSRSTRHRRAGE